MADLNKLLEPLIDEIVERVVERLNTQSGANWPNTSSAAEYLQKEFEKGKDDGFIIADPGNEIVTPEPEPELPKGIKELRMEFWNSKTAQTIRDHLENFEKLGMEKYRAMNKAKLVQYAADLEALTGKNLWDWEATNLEPEDEDVADLIEQEQEAREQIGDEEVEMLDYETALTLDLDELKEIAKGEGIPEDKLTGLDVEAVCDLIFAEEDTVYSVDDLMNMDIESLKGIANELKLEYDPEIARQDLALTIAKFAS